jgi:hypothetical protein
MAEERRFSRFDLSARNGRLRRIAAGAFANSPLMFPPFPSPCAARIALVAELK